MIRGLSRWLAALAVVVVGVVALTAVASRIREAITVSSAFEQRAVAAEAQTQAQQVVVDSLQQLVEHLRRVATVHSADIARRRVEVVKTDSLRPPPADCAPNLLARDSLLAAQDRQIVTLAGQARVAQQAAGLLQVSVDTLTAALHARPRPSLFVGKTLSAGAFVGYCTTGKLCLGVGLTVNLGGVRL